MKFCITFKTPDAAEYAICRALGVMKQKLICEFCSDIGNCPVCADELKDELELVQNEREKAEKLVKQFIRYDELITIEFDTDTNTATVVKV